MAESVTDPDAELPADHLPDKAHRLPDDAEPAPDVAANLAPAVDAATLAADSGATPRD